MQSETFTILLVAISIIAAIAFMLAIAAFIRLWYSGHRGWARAVHGLVLSSILLIPACYAVAIGARYPIANDISAAPIASLPLVLANNPNDILLQGDEIAEYFPNARARTYPLTVARVFGLAEELVAARGWEFLRRRPPTEDTKFGQINAVATSWLGWRDETVILVDGRGSVTAVAMRSASMFGTADLGVNGRRIEDFLNALDEAVGKAIDEDLAARIDEEPTLPQPPPRN